MQFSPGDTVQLKSGCPHMTVERVGKDESTQEDVVFCTWFEQVGKRQQLQRVRFSSITLEKYEPQFGVYVV
jgi:uncharacterized protein YodC (DUF2158 family)